MFTPGVEREQSRSPGLIDAARGAIQGLLHIEQKRGSGKAADASKPASERQTPPDFRNMTQAERLQDPTTNSAAKQIAGMYAAIDARYGKDSPEAGRMRAAAREAVAQTLERGNQVRAPQVADARNNQDRAPGSRDRPDRDR
jgi:hypothetical protein